MTKLEKVRNGIERWYAKKGLPYVNVHVEYDGDGVWKFWRLNRDGDAECGTSYRNRRGWIDFYGSLEPEPEEEEEEEEEDDNG